MEKNKIILCLVAIFTLISCEAKEKEAESLFIGKVESSKILFFYNDDEIVLSSDRQTLKSINKKWLPALILLKVKVGPVLQGNKEIGGEIISVLYRENDVSLSEEETVVTSQNLLKPSDLDKSMVWSIKNSFLVNVKSKSYTLNRVCSYSKARQIYKNVFDFKAFEKQADKTWQDLIENHKDLK